MHQVMYCSDTVWVRQNDIPEYLHSSDFLQCWDENGGSVEICNNVLKRDTTITDYDDLHHILSTLRFWIVSHIPNSVFDFVFSHIDCDCEAILREFERDFPGVKCLLMLMKVPEEDRWTEALKYHDVSCARYWLECCRLSTTWPNSFIIAAEAGSLACVDYLCDFPFPLNPRACSIAAENGHLDCLKLLHEQGCEWTSWTCEHSAANGHADCLLYAINHGCDLTSHASCAAARNGHVHILRILLPLQGDGPWMSDVANEAAKKGQLECLQYCHSLGIVMGEDVAMYAAQFNHMDCLVYLHEQGHPWSVGVPMMAAYKGHFECLKYAIENGCECNLDAYLMASTDIIRDYLGNLGFGNGHGQVNV